MLNRLKQSTKDWMIKKMNLPEDVILDVPRLTMVGQVHVLIENHQGILHFSSEHVRLKVVFGELSIQGTGLTIKNILPNELLLEGTVEEVRYLNRRDSMQ
ncbi:sporulation protein YqfC [Aliibacillus thermotolerans]|uniref:Sporulation protein YqfC n=1 Tax=Aliibacillus thermotolerans TaxID=1834418 RepID=A0ABW0U8C2_9BACI|nr:sporulation protein YqfC [Aliibacillus thermotolerans]MDA3130741.1 sporulation protein YqfC [Aliibacillus thermotolerans]